MPLVSAPLALQVLQPLSVSLNPRPSLLLRKKGEGIGGGRPPFLYTVTFDPTIETDRQSGIETSCQYGNQLTQGRVPPVFEVLCGLYGGLGIAVWGASSKTL